MRSYLYEIYRLTVFLSATIQLVNLAQKRLTDFYPEVLDFQQDYVIFKPFWVPKKMNKDIFVEWSE